MEQQFSGSVFRNSENSCVTVMRTIDLTKSPQRKANGTEVYVLWTYRVSAEVLLSFGAIG